MSQNLLELRLTLVDAKPPIWRRVRVSSQISLRRLHEIIQAVAGWEDRHKHEFVIAERRYGEPVPAAVIPVHNESLVRLHALPMAVGTTFTYVYDFEDRWDIQVRVERVRPPDPRSPAPFVLDGARAFPPEDSGGVAGYKSLLDALADPGHPDHEKYRHLVAEGFDPARFDPEDGNRRLASLQ